jgi:hypothetical protein
MHKARSTPAREGRQSFSRKILNVTNALSAETDECLLWILRVNYPKRLVTIYPIT